MIDAFIDGLMDREAFAMIEAGVSRSESARALIPQEPDHLASEPSDPLTDVLQTSPIGRCPW